MKTDQQFSATKSSLAPILAMCAMVLLMVAIAPLFAIGWLGALANQGLLAIRWYFRHGRHGRSWLAIYSDGGKWKQHFEAVVVPMLGASAHTVNVSTDPLWSKAGGLEHRVHKSWAGRVEHTPVLIKPPGWFRRTRVVRLHSAYFRFAKHGETTGLDDALKRINM
jgi:hypothetical protein